MLPLSRVAEMPVLRASLLKVLCAQEHLRRNTHSTVRLFFNTQAHASLEILLRMLDQPVCSGRASFHWLISFRSAMFGTSFLFGSRALVIGSVCLARSHFAMHSRS